MSVDPVVSVLILSQPSEVHVTALTLHHLIRSVGSRTQVHVLMNGGFSGELAMLAPKAPALRFHSSPANLGVAGGRNLLLRLPEVRECDYVMILDNDVITPPGHVERLIASLETDPQTGVIGPAIVYLPAVADELGMNGAGSLLTPVSNEALSHLGPRLLEESSWFHLGTHPDWRSVYLHEVQLERRLVRGVGKSEPFFAMNHESLEIRSAVARGSTEPIAASNIAGCCQVFRRRLLDDVGYLIGEFSPYGFEDVEFCIRVTKAGFHNYVDPAIFMLHGTDERHKGRRTGTGRIATQRNFMRCKTLLAWCHDGPNWEASVEYAILRRYLLARRAGNDKRASDYLRAHVLGSVDARRQIRHSVELTRHEAPR